MARIRSIKPEISSDAKLSALQADVRWTFVMCISQADDLGLLPGTARTLTGLLYPVSAAVTEAKLTRWLQQLVSAGLLQPLLGADGMPLLHVANWQRHQSVDKPYFSVLSRSLIRESIANNSRMSSEQVATYSRAIRAGIMDHGPWIMDHGSVCVVLHQNSRTRLTA